MELGRGLIVIGSWRERVNVKERVNSSRIKERVNGSVEMHKMAGSRIKERVNGGRI